MNKHDIFINEYNKLENLLCQLDEAPSDVNMRWLEDTLTDNKNRSKLYLCRITRNYIQHNTDYDTFVAVTDEMIEFLRDLYKIVYSKLLTVNERMIPLNKCIIKEINDNIYETVNIMNSKDYDFVPIIENGKVKGIFSKSTISNLFTDDKINKKSTFKDINEKLLKINKEKICFIKTESLLNDVLCLFKSNEKLELCIVTSTGTNKGNILGIITELDI